jgi:fluoride exporter
MNYLWVAIGGAIGSVGRYWLSGWVARQWGETFPWGTILVNVTGSLLLGFIVTLTSPEGRWLAGSSFRVFFIFGLCGGFTTFSSFSMQTLTLIREEQWLYAGANIVLSIVLCLVAVWVGHALAGSIHSASGD